MLSSVNLCFSKTIFIFVQLIEPVLESVLCFQFIVITVHLFEFQKTSLSWNLYYFWFYISLVFVLLYEYFPAKFFYCLSEIFWIVFLICFQYYFQFYLNDFRIRVYCFCIWLNFFCVLFQFWNILNLCCTLHNIIFQ